MNKVTNLKKRYTWEYMYQVDGCIFTLEQNPNCGSWILVGYDSKDSLDDGSDFLYEAMDLKRHCTFFLKHYFNRADYAAK